MGQHFAVPSSPVTFMVFMSPLSSRRNRSPIFRAFLSAAPVRATAFRIRWARLRCLFSRSRQAPYPSDISLPMKAAVISFNNSTFQRPPIWHTAVSSDIAACSHLKSPVSYQGVSSGCTTASSCNSSINQSATGKQAAPASRTHLSIVPADSSVLYQSERKSFIFRRDIR